MGVRSRIDRGQMTVELAVAMPVLIIVAVIVVNAMTFFVDCAVFDRAVRDSVRAYASAPAYGEGPGQSCALVEQAVRDAVDQPNVEISVSHGTVGFDFDQYTAVIEYRPTLFGLGLRSEVFGVALPTLSHSTSYVVDTYKAGVIV